MSPNFFPPQILFLVFKNSVQTFRTLEQPLLREKLPKRRERERREKKTPIIVDTLFNAAHASRWDQFWKDRETYHGVYIVVPATENKLDALVFNLYFDCMKFTLIET